MSVHCGPFQVVLRSFLAPLQIFLELMKVKPRRRRKKKKKRGKGDQNSHLIHEKMTTVVEVVLKMKKKKN